MKKTFLTTGAFAIRYHDRGKGVPLLFLHGYLESLNVWSDFAGAFPEEFRVILMDLPGHGQSECPGPVATMEIMAEAVVRLLDDLGIERCFVTGHSMGGYVALALLERYPDRLSGLCLFHSHPKADTPAVVEKRLREIGIVEQGRSRLLIRQNIPNLFADDHLQLFSREVHYVQRLAGKTPDAGILAAIRGLMARPDRSDVLAQAQVRCLQIIGIKDKYIPFEEVALKTELPPDSERLILEHSGHMGFFEEKARVYKEMLRFLNRI